MTPPAALACSVKQVRPQSALPLPGAPRDLAPKEQRVNTDIPGLPQILDFVRQSQRRPLTSTGATLVTFSGDLYNVEGSDPDPKKVPGYSGKSWKVLLVGMGIPATSTCYVTNAPADPGSSHPKFSVGGHMTTNSNGTVSNKTCYLMPICSWHNSTGRDRVKFTHTQTQMLKLTGYMEGELAVTFRLRMPSDAPFALLYFNEATQDWEFKDLTEADVAGWKGIAAWVGAPEARVLIERVPASDTPNVTQDAQNPAPGTQHVIRAAQLPGLTVTAEEGVA